MGIDARMLLKVKGTISDDTVLKLAVEAFKRFGDILAIYDFCKPPEHCIVKVKEYGQDGPSILPQEDETLLEVRLHGRYYGKGYERGNLPDYLILAEYFELAIPGVEVFYGGDSSGVLAEPFGKAERQDLFFHFTQFGHSPYSEYFDREKDGPTCPLCKIQMIRYGWGGNYRAWYCPGCNDHVEERDGVRKELGRRES